MRRLAPQVLGALVRRYGRFDVSEDAVQEALLPAALAWPDEGVPDNPRAWLITVAARRLVDEVRSSEARQRRERTAATDELVTSDRGDEYPANADDTLILLFLSCHPALSPASQLAREADRGGPSRASYRAAARRTTSLPEQRYLEGRAARLHRRR